MSWSLVVWYAIAAIAGVLGGTYAGGYFSSSPRARRERRAMRAAQRTLRRLGRRDAEEIEHLAAQGQIHRRLGAAALSTLVPMDDRGKRIAKALASHPQDTWEQVLSQRKMGKAELRGLIVLLWSLDSPTPSRQGDDATLAAACFHIMARSRHREPVLIATAMWARQAAHASAVRWRRWWEWDRCVAVLEKNPLLTPALVDDMPLTTAVRLESALRDQAAEGEPPLPRAPLQAVMAAAAVAGWGDRRSGDVKAELGPAANRPGMVRLLALPDIGELGFERAWEQLAAMGDDRLGLMADLCDALDGDVAFTELRAIADGIDGPLVPPNTP